MTYHTHIIPAGEFKTHCLHIMDEVQQNRSTYVITKRGKPVAQIVPCLEVVENMPSLFGALAGQAVIKGDLMDPLESTWDESKFDDL